MSTSPGSAVAVAPARCTATSVRARRSARLVACTQSAAPRLCPSTIGRDDGPVVTAPSPSLRAVLDELGPIVSVVTAPAGFDVGVGRPVIHDPLGGVPIEAGDVVLAVGTPMHGAAAVELVALAGTA